MGKFWVVHWAQNLVKWDRIFVLIPVGWVDGSVVYPFVRVLSAGRGYDANTEITCMYLTRSEKSIILGVSRYGSDVTGESDELKGDVIVLDTETWKVRNYYPEVSGYPADVLVKYQENYRGGKDKNGKMMDNI